MNFPRCEVSLEERATRRTWVQTLRGFTPKIRRWGRPVVTGEWDSRNTFRRAFDTGPQDCNQNCNHRTKNDDTRGYLTCNKINELGRHETR